MSPIEQDVRAQLVLVSGARGKDAIDLDGLTIETAIQLTEVYMAASADHERTGLETFLAWLQLAASIVGPAASIATAILGVAGAAKAL